MPTPLTYLFSPFRLEPAQRRLVRGDQAAKLGGRALDLLQVLVERRERTVTKHELLDLVWPGLVVDENNLQVQVLALRKLLGPAAIATVPGRGYRFTLPVVVEGGEPPPEDASVPGGESVADGPRSNLPRWAPTLYGRAEELQAVVGLLERHPWVTVVGPGGIGKTRLAQVAARAWGQAAPASVWWVDLAPLTEARLLPATVGLAMGLAVERAADVVAAIAAALPPRPSLIVLDNAEHLLDGLGTFLVRLRQLAPPGLRLLVTSQEPVHATDERVWRIEPLALPDSGALDAVQASGAAALFVARAQAADRRFQLTDANAAAVADICRRLDGIPLAIELAAARVATLGIEGLRSRLDRRLQLLTSGDRTSLQRHRTLRQALDWSHQLLTAPEKAALRRLGVFAGGFTMEAAQQVAAATQDIDRWDVLEHLAMLVDKSLVVAEGDAEPRYRLLETTRLFALERLIEHGEVDAARSAHRDHYLARAEAAHEQVLLAGPAGLPLMDLERDNLFLALAWTRGDDDGSLGLRLAAAMRHYWTSRGLVTRGLETLRAALAHPGVATVTRPRCMVELAASHFCGLIGDHAAAFQHGRSAVGLARELGDADALSLALAGLGLAHFKRGDADNALACADEALAVARPLGDSHALGNAFALHSALHLRARRFDMARKSQQDNLAVRLRTGQRWSQANAHLNLAWIALDRHRPDEAQPHLHAVIGLLQAVDSEYIALELLATTATWAAAAGRPALAVSLQSAEAAQCLRMGMSGDRHDAPTLERLGAARDALDEPARVAADERGRVLGLEAAVALAAAALSMPLGRPAPAP